MSMLIILIALLLFLGFVVPGIVLLIIFACKKDKKANK